jgi:glycosyltransferase involved in cell wall biosynthesis
MKIVVISSWFSEKMGYSENLFPKALAKIGHEVHVIASTAQVYYDSPMYEKTYREHLGPAIVEPGISQIDGFTLHRLEFSEIKTSSLHPWKFRGIRIRNLQDYLHRLQPDVIQVVNLIDEPTTYDAAVYAKNSGKQIFTESHLHSSVFRKDNERNWKEKARSTLYLFHRQLKLVNGRTAFCYPIAPDAAEIVESLYHVPKAKIKIQPLGVDCELFCHASTPELVREREVLRQSLGVKSDDLLCIYTGRFSHGKNPQLLAQAVHRLQQSGEKIKALFLGNGSEAETYEIKSKQGCIVHPFVDLKRLPAYYRAADIGVWPREESTSQLDAAACGLPLILSNAIRVTERVDGNGLLYEEGNVDDLARKILQLKDDSLRKAFSGIGIRNISRRFSWLTIASERIKDYELTLL